MDSNNLASNRRGGAKTLSFVKPADAVYPEVNCRTSILTACPKNYIPERYHHTSQITSPPNFFFLASLLVIKPWGVEIIARPKPDFTDFNSRQPR